MQLFCPAVLSALGRVRGSAAYGQPLVPNVSQAVFREVCEATDMRGLSLEPSSADEPGSALGQQIVMRADPSPQHEAAAFAIVEQLSMQFRSLGIGSHFKFFQSYRLFYGPERTKEPDHCCFYKKGAYTDHQRGTLPVLTTNCLGSTCLDVIISSPHAFARYTCAGHVPILRMKGLEEVRDGCHEAASNSTITKCQLTHCMCLTNAARRPSLTVECAFTEQTPQLLRELRGWVDPTTGRARLAVGIDIKGSAEARKGEEPGQSVRLVAYLAEAGKPRLEQVDFSWPRCRSAGDPQCFLWLPLDKLMPGCSYVQWAYLTARIAIRGVMQTATSMMLCRWNACRQALERWRAPWAAIPVDLFPVQCYIRDAYERERLEAAE